MFGNDGHDGGDPVKGTVADDPFEQLASLFVFAARLESAQQRPGIVDHQYYGRVACTWLPLGTVVELIDDSAEHAKDAIWVIGGGHGRACRQVLERSQS